MQEDFIRNSFDLPVPSRRNGVQWKHLGTRVYDETNRLFLIQSESGENRLGAIWESPVLLGADDSTVERLRSALSSFMPVGTFVQFGLLSVPDASYYIGRYTQTKRKASSLMKTMVNKRAAFVQKTVDENTREMNGVLCTRQRVIVSITVPCEPTPSENELRAVTDICSKLADGFNSAGLSLRQMDDSGWLALTRRFFNIYEQKDDLSKDDYLPLREQVFAPGNSVEIFKNKIKFNDGEYYSRTLSVKEFPRSTGLDIMNFLVGSPLADTNQISEPFWMSLTIHFPNQEKKSGAIKARQAFMANQSFGAMISSIPVFAHKKRGLDMMANEIEGNGATIVEANFGITLFSRDEERLSAQMGAIPAWAASFGMTLREDKFILGPLFYGQIPFGFTVHGISNLYRFNTMTVMHAVQFLPIIGDWTASGDGGCSIYHTRRGRVAIFDPYDSTTNYNGVVFATSGAGKSFVAQQFACDLLSQGAKVWVVDQGRSYEKLCSVVGGQYITFSDDSRICLNPFTQIVQIDEEMDSLKAVFAKMAAPEGGLDDFAMASLEQAIKSVWDRLTNKATVTEIADWCNSQPDSRISDIGQMLYPFTRHGSFGFWFDGASNVDFTRDFVVMEIQDLASKKTLQQVVLMLLMDRVAIEMYHTEGRKKVFLVDESWSLIDDPMVGKALTAGFRKVRKHDGAMWIITQSLADLYESPNGRVIIDNCAWQFILRQVSESIQSSVKSGRLNIDAYMLRILESVHTVPGKYSEIMIRNISDGGWGVVRFIADRFSQILFSTKGWEREEVLNVARDGGDVSAFIEDCVNKGR